MSLIRLISYFIIGYILWKFLRWLVAPLRKAGPKAADDPRRQGRLLVKCVGCGTFITEARALIVRGKPYCSAACAGTGANAR